MGEKITIQKRWLIGIQRRLKKTMETMLGHEIDMKNLVIEPKLMGLTGILAEVRNTIHAIEICFKCKKEVARSHHEFRALGVEKDQYAHNSCLPRLPNPVNYT